MAAETTSNNSIKVYASEEFVDQKTEQTLANANTYTDNAVVQKSQVQLITWEADD